MFPETVQPIIEVLTSSTRRAIENEGQDGSVTRAWFHTFATTRILTVLLEVPAEAKLLQNGAWVMHKNPRHHIAKAERKNIP